MNLLSPLALLSMSVVVFAGALVIPIPDSDLTQSAQAYQSSMRNGVRTTTTRVRTTTAAIGRQISAPFRFIGNQVSNTVRSISNTVRGDAIGPSSGGFESRSGTSAGTQTSGGTSGTRTGSSQSSGTSGSGGGSSQSGSGDRIGPSSGGFESGGPRLPAGPSASDRLQTERQASYESLMEHMRAQQYQAPEER